MEKLTKYRQLAYETAERRPGYEIIVVPLIIGALGEDIRQIMIELGKLLKKEELLKGQSAKCRKQY